MDLSNLVESPLDTQQKPYWQVLQEHQQALKDYPELAGTTVQEFAQSMGPGYEAGTGADNALRRGSGNIDIALHHFGGGAPGYTGPTLSGTLGGPQEGWDLPKLVGGAVKTGAEAVGAGPEVTQKLEQVGEGFPRMAVDLGVGGALGGIPGIALASGTSTYGETGSALQGGISGLSALVIPKAAEKVGGAFMRAAGAKTLAETSPDLLNKATRLLPADAAEALGEKLDPNVLQKLAGVAGAQVGMFGVGEATEAAQNATGEGTMQEKLARLGEQFSPSSLVATGFAQLPWTVHDLARTKGTDITARDKSIMQDVRSDFARRYAEESVKLGQGLPEPAEVKQAITKVESGKTPQDPDWFSTPQGQVLQSMGQTAVFEPDMKRPLRTNTGDWPVPDAVEGVKAAANQLLVARPELGIEKLGDAHDQRIASALKVVEQGSEGKLSREEMTRQASLKVVDSMTQDSSDLGDISPEYADLNKEEAKRYASESEKNQKDAEIVGKLDQTSPTYDPETAKRMSLLSGNVPERQAAGATERTDLFKQPKQPITVQMPGKNGRTIVIHDSIIEQIMRDLSGNPNLRPPLTGDATARARRAADDYNGTVDVNDPASMGRFYNYVKKAVTRAQLGFNRVRGPEPGITDKEGTVLSFPNEETATQRAEDLNQGNEDETVRFEPRKNPDNTYRVVRAEYYRNLSSTPTEEGGRKTGVALGEEDRFEPPEGMGGEEEEGIPKTTLDQFTQDTKEAADRNAILEQFHALNLERDPAVREARNEAMTRNLINFVKAMPDGKIRELLIKDTTGKNLPSIKTAGDRKATFVKIMQFLRDKGDLKLEVKPIDKDRVSVKGRGNLPALNTYLGEHGFKDPNALNAPKMRGLSVFEQFHVLAKYLATEFIDPNKVVDFTQRPRGDFAWMPPGAFKNEPLENQLLVSWPKAYPKGMKFTPSEHQEAPETVLKLQTRSGGEKRIESKYPLADLFVKATKHQLTISAGELHDMFKKFVPGADQNLMDLLKSFVSQPFGSTIRVGFGIAKDGRTKGYYHLDDLLTGTGILLSPFSETDSPRHIRSVDRPEDVLPHLVHELAHAHTIFGYHNDPAIKAEVNEVWKKISDYHQAQVGVGAEGKFTVDNMHSLSSPEELLASVFNDGLLHEYLKTIPDESPRGGRNQQFNSVFDHIMDIIRRVFAKIVGPDGANTMLQRVTDLAQRTMQVQESLREEKGFGHEGDIYSAINKPRGERLVGDLVHDTKPEPVPPAKERAQVYPQDVPGVVRHPGEPEPSPTDASTFDVAEAAKKDAKDLVHRTRRLEQVSPAYAQTRRDVLPAAVERIGQLPPGEESILLSKANKPDERDAKITELVKKNNQFLEDSLYKGMESVNLEEWTKLDKEVNRLILERAEENRDKLRDKPVSFTDSSGYSDISQLQEADLVTLTRRNDGKGWRLSYFDNKDNAIGHHDYTTWDEAYTALHEKDEHASAADWRPRVVGGGQTLESRLPKQPLLDSMKAASEYVTEDKMGQWFKPLSAEHFERVFGPIFGGRLVKEDQGGQVGFRASPVAFANVTDADLARAPKPPIKTWASSAHEMMKRLFMKNGESDLNAEALAGYNMTMASLLRGTDNAIWSQVSGKATGIEPGSNKVTLGVALMPEKIGGLTSAAATRLEVGETLRHEQTHLAGFVDTNLQLPSDIRESIRNVNDAFGRLNPGEQNTLLDSLTNLSDETRTKPPYMEALRNNNEFASEFMAHVGQGLGNVPKPNAYIRDIMRFVPDDLSNLLVTTTLRRAQALDGLQKITEETVAQRYGIKYEPIKKAIEELATAFKSLGREALDIALDQADFYRMRNLYPDMYKELVKTNQTAIGNIDKPGYLFQSREPQIYKEVKNFMGLNRDDRLPTKPGIWSRYLTQFSQFASKYPIARPFYDMLSSADELAHQGYMQMRSVLAGGTGDPGSLLDKKVTKNLGTFLKNPRLQGIFDKIALDVQTEGDAKTKSMLAAANGDVMQVPGDVDVMTPEYMDALHRKYGTSATERPIIDSVLNGVRNQIKLGSAKMVASRLEELNTLTAKAIVMNTNLGPEQARGLAKQFVDAVRAVDSGDVETASKLHDVLSQAIPDVAAQAKLLEFVEGGWDQTKRLERFLSIRMPYFMSERRFGDYGLWWKQDGKVVSHYFKNGDERSKFIVSHNIDPIRQINPNDKNFGVSPDMFGALDEAQARNLENLKALFGDQEGQRIAQMTDVSSALRQEMQSQDLTKAMAPRKGAFSRQYLNMFDTQQQFVGALVNSIKNKQIRLESELLYSHPEFANQPIIKNVIQKHIDAVLTPDKPIGRAISQANFVYFLGGNPSSIIMQSFHQLMGLAPTLVDNGATVAGSYGLIAKANKLYHEAHKLGAGSGQYKDQQINDLVNRYRQGGGIQLGITSELDYDQDLALVNRLRVGAGQNEFTGFDLLKNRAYQGLSLLRRMYNVVPHYNNEVAFISSILHLREQNPTMSNEQLYSEARFLKDNAMYPGGKSNRPGLFTALPRSAAQSIWSLQTYANGLTTLMGNLIRKSFAPKGVTPAQATQARKAAVQMMTTQLVFAGALGFPFAHLMLLGLSKIFPNHNVEQDVRDAFAQLGGDDEALGGWLSTAMTTGVPSAMSYAPDVGSRFALSGALKVSPYNGLEMSDLAGPVGGIALNVFKAIQAGAEGQPMKSVEDIMPNGMKRIFQSLEQGSTYVSQGNGNQLVSDLTPIEQIARTIGFTPSRVARIIEAQHLAKVSEAVDSAENQQFIDKTANLTIAGRDQEAHQAITERALSSKGLHNPVELTRAVTKRVEQKTLPVDPRNFGNKQTIELNRSLKGTLGEQSVGPSNTDRAVMQQQLAQRLGFFKAAPSPRSLMHSSQLDHLLELYPHLTKPQASLLLSRATASSPIAQELTGAGE